MFTQVSRRRLRGALLLLLSVAATAPAWIARHPPLEDLPTHPASRRVLQRYSDPACGLDEDFRLNLLHTQYLLYCVTG
jgi:hypothetical protein